MLLVEHAHLVSFVRSVESGGCAHRTQDLRDPHLLSCSSFTLALVSACIGAIRGCQCFIHNHVAWFRRPLGIVSDELFPGSSPVASMARIRREVHLAFCFFLSKASMRDRHARPSERVRQSCALGLKVKRTADWVISQQVRIKHPPRARCRNRGSSSGSGTHVRSRASLACHGGR